MLESLHLASCLAPSPRSFETSSVFNPLHLHFGRRLWLCLRIICFSMSSVQQLGLQQPDLLVQVNDHADTTVVGADVEKNAVQESTVADASSDHDSIADSKDFQVGVRRVRAITTVWSKKTLISMFAMYVSLKCPDVHTYMSLSLY
jgi:hypothetical protein